MIDLAIIGAGPAGLLAGARCAEAGLDVLILEEHPRIGQPTHCTGVVSLETADYAKIPDDIVLSRLSLARLSAPGGGHAEVRWEGRGSEQIVTIDRAAFDLSLAARAAAAGAALRTSARVDRIGVDADGVELQVTGERFRAAACVLACGVAYRFQRELGLGLPGQVAHTAQLEVDAVPAETVTLHLGRGVAPEGFIWTVPVARMGRSRLKIGVLARGDAAEHLQRFLRRPEVRERLVDEPGEPVRRLLPLRPIAKTYADRLLVIGDAGGFTKPTTGGGIFYSLLTASLASETLVEAFGAGRFDEEFLERYERRWQETLGQELRVGDWLRQLASRCSDAEIDMLVRAFATDDVQAVIRRTARFNWHRGLILSLVRQKGIAALLFRSLFR